MWCERTGMGEKDTLRDYITYFEGTCEFCIGNMGINRYLAEIMDKMKREDINDAETNMYVFYIYGVIEYKLEQFDEAVRGWSTAENYARRLGNDIFLAKIASYLAIYYYVNKNKKLTEQYFSEACVIFEKNRMYTEMALHYINYLWYKRYDDNRAEVLKYLDTAFYYVQMSDSPMDARVYLHLGYIYKTIFNDFVRGVGYLSVAQDMCHRYGNVEMESMTLHVLADGYMQLGHSDEALKIYERLMSESRYNDITENLKCMILGNMIPCCIEHGMTDEAGRMLERMESYVPDTQLNLREQFECIAKWLRARLYTVRRERLDEVPGLLKECEAIYARNNRNFQVDAFDFKLKGSYGDYYAACDDWDRARLSYLEQGRIADRYGDHCLKETCAKLAEIYTHQGNYKKALEYRKEESSYFDRIRSTNILNQYDILYRKFFRAIQDEQLRSIKRENEQLEEQVITDDLTGVYNRLYLQNYADDETHRGMIGAIMFDLDDFKAYNDHYGHTKGDACIAQVAAMLSEGVSAEHGALIRYGGEEFLALIPDKSPEELKVQADHMIKNIYEAHIVHEYATNPGYLSVSAGCGFGRVDSAQDIVELIDRADKAMYRAKASGKNASMLSEG